MKTLMGTLLTLAAVAMFLIGCDIATTGYASRIVDAGDGMLTIEDPKTAAIKTHEVAPDAEVTRDGQPAALDELQPGDTVDVETDQVGDSEIATAVHAQSTEQEPSLQPQPLDREDAGAETPEQELPMPQVPQDMEPVPETTDVPETPDDAAEIDLRQPHEEAPQRPE